MTLPLKRNENLQFEDIRDYSAKMKNKKIVIRKQIQEIKLELPHKMSNRTIIPNK